MSVSISWHFRTEKRIPLRGGNPAVLLRAATRFRDYALCTEFCTISVGFKGNWHPDTEVRGNPGAAEITPLSTELCTICEGFEDWLLRHGGCIPRSRYFGSGDGRMLWIVGRLWSEVSYAGVRDARVR